MVSPAIAADLAPWVCNTTECMKLSLVRPGSDDSNESRQEFQPLFTYPIFGEREVVFGYKGLSIQLQFASGSLRLHPRIDYASQWQPSSSSSATVTREIPAADDIMGMLKKYLPPDCISNSDEFARIVQQDAETFRPIGEKVHEYSRETDEGEEMHFEIYRSTFANEKFREYHHRMRIFVLLYIEGASYIVDDDEKWEIYTVFNRQGKGESASYHFVGYCTAYPYFFWPECTRFRISQFVILPPYQSKGHGSELYRLIYQTCMARSDVKEMPVEDPNDEFADMRDKNDLRYLREHHAFDGLKAPVSKEQINELSSRFKLTERQFQRCLEMHLLSQVNKLDRQAYKQFRLQVKRRLYLFNLDALRTLDPEDRKEKLHQTYEGVIEDYHRLLEMV